MKYHTLFFFDKLEKMTEKLSSAAVVIGALRVNTIFLPCSKEPSQLTELSQLIFECILLSGGQLIYTGFYTKMNVWGSLGLNFEYDGGPIIEIGGPIFLYKLRILEGSTSFREGSISVVLRSVILRAMFGPLPIFWGAI